MNNGYLNNIWVIDTVDYSRLQLQWVPAEIDYSPDSEFVAISSPGRNNSFFHFGGSDDTVTFELDWHSTQENREDVITKCRWLESKTKNTNSLEGVHPILFHFGGYRLFSGSDENSQTWLLTSAKYKLSNFSRPHNMYPTQARQTLILKRITANQRTHDEIKLVSPNEILSAGADPDYLGRLFQDRQVEPTKGNTEQIAAQLRLQSEEFEKSNQTLRYMKSKAYLLRGAQMAVNAAQYFANQTIYTGLEAAGKTAAKIQTLGDNLNQKP